MSLDQVSLTGGEVRVVSDGVFSGPSGSGFLLLMGMVPPHAKDDECSPSMESLSRRQTSMKMPSWKDEVELSGESGAVVSSKAIS